MISLGQVQGEMGPNTGLGEHKPDLDPTLSLSFCFTFHQFECRYLLLVLSLEISNMRKTPAHFNRFVKPIN